MNLLPRLLGLGLFVVLTMLAAVLAAAALPGAATHGAGHAPPPSLASRLALPLALTGVVLGGALLVSLAVRPGRGPESRPPLRAAQHEIGALAQLAAASTAQVDALAAERSGRQRAEADARLQQQMLARVQEERVRLGRDLHDGIIQSLYATGLTIESARALAAENPAEADRRLAQCLQHLNASIRTVRASIAGLAPERLSQSGFSTTLDALLHELGAGRAVQFDVKIDEAATARLTPEQTTEALQIAREAVSNSLRHGGASLVTVRCHAGDGAVSLLVQDNGTGFAPAHHAQLGHGLGNMQARAARLGGEVRFVSSPGQGARVLLTVPVTVSA